MKENIRQRARELGFDDCRFTTAEAPDHAAAFQKWIAQKHHGEMSYLERNAHKRVNPQEVLPGARSVVILAASYTEACCVPRVASSTDAECNTDATRLAAPKRSEGGNTQHGIVAR